MIRDLFDPGDWGQPVALDPPKPAPPTGDTLPRPAEGELYLGGPIPLGWLSRAAGLPGRALHVALVLWFDARVRRRKGPVLQPRRVTLSRFGVGCRRTLYRALRALERAGLVRVTRRPGRPFLVTILPAPPLARRGQIASSEEATARKEVSRAEPAPNGGGSPAPDRLDAR